MTIRETVKEVVDEVVDEKMEEMVEEIELSQTVAVQEPFVNKHWASVALALAAGAIGYSGHDGWGWCLLIICIIE